MTGGPWYTKTNRGGWLSLLIAVKHDGPVLSTNLEHCRKTSGRRAVACG